MTIEMKFIFTYNKYKKAHHHEHKLNTPFSTSYPNFIKHISNKKQLQLKAQFSALPNLDFCRAIWTLERPCTVVFRQLRYRLFAKHVPARHQHWRVVFTSLFTAHGTHEYRMKLKILIQIDRDR
ncbi:hypothetical protein HanRHA438_Chr11g0483341 [Helianthus annuus]|uniref:Uncharacterized protein n=1 Tax=Helianthus annuus TaxID=4232 RepID=A0A9K3HKW0_HELAN|nr:hypothetical protein HanXRQr2_Chr11g0469661 [Helianthus annuus]KAJ0868904.1 hypothetical protein HanRHA438_Chr11g0483341 [Helianthus annuus]